VGSWWEAEATTRRYPAQRESGSGKCKGGLGTSPFWLTQPPPYPHIPVNPFFTTDDAGKFSKGDRT
jgi:hypothetical protein